MQNLRGRDLNAEPAPRNAELRREEIQTSTACERNGRRRSQIRVAIIVAATLGGSAVAPADGLAPVLSPDRIDDAPSTLLDPYPTFDTFAWRAFLALNWPARLGAGLRGEPDRSKTLADPGPRVWETFKSEYELFPIGADGRPAAPTAASSFDGPNPCGRDVGNRTKTLVSFKPYAEFNQPGLRLGEFSNPLVAQNRTYTRYEVRMNAIEYDAIAREGWSQGLNLPDAARPANLPTGSIAVKASWRLLTDADTPAVRARYYVVTGANFVDVARSRAAGRIVCTKGDVALVGMHIMVKTRHRPQWLWGTFEHVDNVPPAGEGEAREPDAKDAGVPYSYFDPSTPDRALPPLGSSEARPVDLGNPPSLDPEPMQVRRLRPIHASTMAMNRAYWALPGIRGTVFEHYMLVASQWPTTPLPVGPQNDGGSSPGWRSIPTRRARTTNRPTSRPRRRRILANTTMETYLQDLSSGCMGCHSILANARGFDFAGILSGLH